MNATTLDRKVKSVEKYLDDYYKKVTDENARQAVSDFKPQWEVIVGYREDCTYDFQSKYGQALLTYSNAVFKLKKTTEKQVSLLKKLIDKYDNFNDARYKYADKECLYFNLGSCWHKLGEPYYNNAIAAYKKYVYYLIIQSNNIKYGSVEAYAFRKCSEYLYQNLINQKLNLSSPVTFNDPFDCPIKDLLNNEDEISALVRRAYVECLKIACFTSNVKLPYYDSDKRIRVDNEKKNGKARKEFLNELMWAHYADSHHGICIKYRFNESIEKLGGEDKNVVAYFKDVSYSDSDMSGYSNKDAINLKDAFFLKGKAWKYENELRYLYYDLTNSDNYATIDIPDCIEAIYFGLKCSEADKTTIRNIMKNYSRPVAFYQMEIDAKHFGQLKPRKL